VINRLQVIPVIDILNGIVVHAIKGQRKEYRPLQSILTDSVDPLKVAMKFKQLGFNQLYIADLDAIISCSMNFQVFKEISNQTELNLMVDAGLTSAQRTQHLRDSGVSKFVIGTETLQRQEFIGEAIRCFGSDHVVVSLDLKGEKTIVKLGFNGCKSPICLLEEFKRMGVSQVIILDLIRVGSGQGVNIDLLRKIKQKTDIEIYAGGGVRNISDLIELKTLGISGALVATALHNGEIRVNDLNREGFL
jgi:phosphoribosylformimino-5-aminoimidazole carboxamide ribotide isomerase